MEYFKRNGQIIGLGKSRQSVTMFERSSGTGAYNVIVVPCIAEHVPDVTRIKKYNFQERSKALKFYKRLKAKFLGGKK